MEKNSSSLALPFLSPLEFRVFRVLSVSQPLTIREIGEQLALRDPRNNQAYTTFSTILQRLVTKGYVARVVEISPAHLFRAKVDFEEVLKAHVENFLDEFLITEPHELQTVVKTVTGR